MRVDAALALAGIALYLLLGERVLRKGRARRFAREPDGLSPRSPATFTRMRKALSLVAVLGSLLLAPACGAQTISGAELAAEIQSGKAPVIVDVRSEREYGAGHVPGAIHLPFQSALARADEIPAPKSAPVVLYCEHGPRAVIAKAELRSRGFENVLLLEGHMAGWRDAELPIETPPSPAPAGAEAGDG